MSDLFYSAYDLISADDLYLSGTETYRLDVRSALEFSVEHIALSINIPQDELELRLHEMPRDRRIVLICRSGDCAKRAAWTLAKAGIEPAILEGGLSAWLRDGLPVVVGKKMLSLERPVLMILASAFFLGIILGLEVNPWFFLLAGFFSISITLVWLTGTGQLAMLLAKSPWNKFSAADVTAKSTDSNGDSQHNNTCCV
jgi:rhodanese-related sulfurtransferase